MKELIESVELQATTLTVAVNPPLPVDLPTVAVATAIRVFERYPIMDRLAIRAGESELTLSREDVLRLLAPDGFTVLREWGRWPQVLARAVQGYVAQQAAPPPPSPEAEEAVR